MSIKRPDKYEHSNPELSIIDALNVIGGLKQVATFATGPSGLGVYSGAEDKFKKGTFLIALDTNILYYFTGATVTDTNAWSTLGDLGPMGTQGFQGVIGYQGDMGSRGFQGFQGKTGPQGTRGLQGTQGTKGAQGITGSAGPTGSIGPQGYFGPTGYQGLQGPQGSTSGLVGPQGPVGGIDGIGGTNEIAWFDTTVSLTSGPDFVRLGNGQFAIYGTGSLKIENSSSGASNSTVIASSEVDLYSEDGNSTMKFGTIGINSTDENTLSFSRSRGTNWGAEVNLLAGDRIFEIIGEIYHNGSYYNQYINRLEATGATLCKLEWELNGIRRFALESTGQLAIGSSVSNYKFPIAPGGSGEMLVLNGSNDLQWTAVPTSISGSGTTDYIARWITPSILGTGLIRDDGHSVGVNTAPDSASVLYIENTTAGTFPVSVSNRFSSTAGQNNAALYVSNQEIGLVDNNNHAIGLWIKSVGSKHQNIGAYIYAGTASWGTGASFPGYVTNIIDYTDVGEYLVVQTGGSLKKRSVGLYVSVNPARVNVENYQYGLYVDAYSSNGYGYIGVFKDGTERSGRFMKSVNSLGAAHWADITCPDVIGLSGALDLYLPLTGGSMNGVISMNDVINMNQHEVWLDHRTNIHSFTGLNSVLSLNNYSGGTGSSLVIGSNSFIFYYGITGPTQSWFMIDPDHLTITSRQTDYANFAVQFPLSFTAGATASFQSLGGTVAYLDDIYDENLWTSGSSGNYSIKAKNDSAIDSLGNYSFAEGYNTTSSGEASHAEGTSTIASEYASHAEGNSTTASGVDAHSEGTSTVASGDSSHAEGYETTASGELSHSEGNGTVAHDYCEHVGGQFNIIGTGSTTSFVNSDNLFTLGNGANIDNRSNAFQIKKDGTIIITTPQSSTTNNILVVENDGTVKSKILNDIYTTGATLSGTTAIFTRNDSNTYQLDLNCLGGLGIVNKTYAELKAMYDGSTLTPGQLYKITDFATVHNILDGNTTSGDINTGTTEPLILLATSTNAFDKQAYSTLFPKDIIYYDITGGDTRDIAFFDDSTPIDNLKGVIYYRKDTIQNVECWYDFRNVKYRRWLVNATPWVASGTYVAKHVYEYNSILYKCIKNHTGLTNTPDVDTTNWIKWLDKTQNRSWTSDKTQFNIGGITTTNLIMSDPIDVYTFGDYYNWVNDVEIGKIHLDYVIDNYSYSSKLNNIVFNTTDSLYTCFSNVFGDNCFNNTVGNYFNINTVGYGFNNNMVGDSFNNNTVGNYFYNNTVGNDFSNNTVGNDFFNNTVGDGFNFNTVGNYFFYNTVGDGFNYNTVGNAFDTNTVGNNFRYNDLKYSPTLVNFTTATHVYADYNCEIFKSSTGNLRLKYSTDTNDIITEITA